MAKKAAAPIVRLEQLEEGIYDLVVCEKDLADEAVAGQFVSLYLKDESRLLPRPISICEINPKEHTIRMVFRVVGEGTRQLSNYKPGDFIEVMGPLGNGFADMELKQAMVIGGGIGIPPMLELAKKLRRQGVKVTAVLGYRDGKCFLSDEFSDYATVVIATEDGSAGVKGTVIDAIREKGLCADALFACGPKPMLRGVKEYSEQKGIPAQVSMEERMACGIGACLACVCRTKEKDEHSQVNNKRICKDGPVFFVQDLEW